MHNQNGPGSIDSDDLGEARGQQELFTRQAPQRLKTLREHALIESTVSSNRIEGVTVHRRNLPPSSAASSFNALMISPP